MQRVSEAHVEVDGAVTGSIGTGILLLLGIAKGDSESNVQYLIDKIVGLRIFSDENGKMNRSLEDISGGLLIVSQFTLYGDTRKGRRPSFDQAALADDARRLYDYFVLEARQRLSNVETGVFQASMKVHLVNDGPVTILCESGAQ